MKRRPISRFERPALITAMLLASVIAALAPALAQEPESTEPFFSVSSQQTYSPLQNPKIWIQFRQVDRLYFRIYRVKDPVAFFAKLRDAHSFGS